MKLKARTIIAAAAPVIILGALLLTIDAPSVHLVPHEEQFVPGHEIEPLHADPYYDEGRRRGILIPKRMKEILSYHKTALA